MGLFNEYVNQKDEGVLGQTWGALKGAYQGWKQSGFEDYGTVAQQQGRMTPQQTELRKVNYALTNAYQVINQIRDPELRQEILSKFTPLYQNITSLFHKHSQFGDMR